MCRKIWRVEAGALVIVGNFESLSCSHRDWSNVSPVYTRGGDTAFCDSTIPRQLSVKVQSLTT